MPVSSREPEPSKFSQAPVALSAAPASGDQIEDQDDQRNDQQKVNQAAGNMEAETQ